MWNLESYRRDGPQEDSDRLWSTGFVKSILEEFIDVGSIEIPEESIDVYGLLRRIGPSEGPFRRQFRYIETFGIVEIPEESTDVYYLSVLYYYFFI